MSETENLDLRAKAVAIMEMLEIVQEHIKDEEMKSAFDLCTHIEKAVYRLKFDLVS